MSVAGGCQKPLSDSSKIPEEQLYQTIRRSGGRGHCSVRFHSQSLNVLGPMRMDRSAKSRSTISFSVISLRSSIIPMM